MSRIRGNYLICSLVVLFLVVSQAVAQEKPVYGFPEAFPEVHAFFDWQFINFQEEGYVEGNADFKIWNLYLMFNSAIRENVNTVVEIEAGQRDFYKYLNFVQTKVDWKLNRYANLAIGKFFVPFGPGPEVNYYTPFRKLISRPYIYSLREQLPRKANLSRPGYWKLFPLTLPANNWRDVGIGFEGEAPIKEKMKVKYNLAVVNGLKQETDCFHCHAHRHGDNMTTLPTPENNCLTCHAPHHRQENWDNNSNKTIAGRIGFLPKEGIELGISYATGKYDKEEKYGISLFGIDGDINLGKLSIRGEYVTRKVEADEGILSSIGTSTAAATGVKGSFTLEGYYIRVAYRILEGKKHLNYLDVALRYDVIDPNKDVEDELDRNRWTLGLALSPYPHMLFKLEYQMVDEPNATTKSKNDGYMFSLSAAF